MIPETANFLLQEELKLVPVEQIVLNPYQPRRIFKPEDLEELAQSIRSVGLIHPPLVRPLPDSALYELVSGERRFRAAQLAGLTAIPVFVRKTNHSTSAEAALIENIQRVDLNALEIAKALRQLMSEFNLNQETIASRLGKKRSTIANYLRLLTLPPVIQESVSKELITMGHAKAILSLEEEEKQLLLHELILRDDLSVREAEKGAARIAEKAVKQKLSYAPRNFYLEQLAAQLREQLGTKVSIQAKGKRGRITLDYYGYDDLDRLLALIGVNQKE
jgi:ParB family chromosome partitioning protein